MGTATAYRTASITVNIPATSTLYFSVEVNFEDVNAGGNSWENPKLIIYDGSGTKLSACNFNEPIEDKWYSTYCTANTSGFSQVKLELGMQNCTGTFKIKLPLLSDSEPLVSAYDFPFPIPSDTSCTISINTSEFTPFNNDLLSTNCHFSWASYSWGDKEIIDVINNYFPMSNLRFPGGTVANFYDYETDGHYGDPATFERLSRKNNYNKGFKFDYPGMRDQAKKSGASTTLLFNVMFDDVVKNKERLQSRLNDGPDVKWVELGNEHYFGEQAFYNIAGGDGWKKVDIDKYISHTKSVVTGLKEIDPNIKTSVCASHLNFEPGSWSASLAAENYYDAVTVHSYIDVWNPELNFTTGAKLLKSYKQTRDVIHEYKKLFGQIPMLVSEWGIQDGPKSFLNILARADMFLALQEGHQHDGVVQQADMHMFYHSDKNSDGTLTFYDGTKMVFTATGAMYSQLFQVFKNNNVYDVRSKADSLDSDLPGVIARAVDTGNSIKVFVVNKLPVISPLHILIDGAEYSGDHIIFSYHKDVLTDWPNAYNTPQDPWSTIESNGIPQVPAYSIAVVSIAKNATPVKNVDSPEIEMYPNPTMGLVHFNIETEYTIFNLSGKVVAAGKKDYADISDLKSGMYIIRINNSNYKIVKQ